MTKQDRSTKGEETRIACRGLLLLLLVAALGAPAAGQQPGEPWRPAPGDWPMFMHNAQNTGQTPATLPLQRLHLRWHQTFWEWTHLWSQPVIAGSDLYLAMMDGVLVHLDADSGRENWRHQAADAIAITPCIVDGLIIYGDFAGRIVALDRRDGRPRWSIQAGGAIYSSPTYADGRLFVGSNDGRLYCVDPVSGQVLWTFQAGEMIYSSPAYWDGVVYFASEDMYAYAVNAADGQLRWKHRLFGPCNRSNHPFVAAEAGVVVFTAPSNSDSEAGHSQKDTIWRSVPKPWLQKAWNTTGAVGHWQAKDIDEIVELSIRNIRQTPELQAIYVYDLKSGQEVRDFTYVGTSGQRHESPFLPLVTWYNNAARGVLVDGHILYLQDIENHVGGVFRVDLKTREFRRDSLDGHPHRGDEFTALTAAGNVPLAGFMEYVGAYNPQTRRRFEMFNEAHQRHWYVLPLPPPQLKIWPNDNPEGWQPGMREYLRMHDQAMKEGRSRIRAMVWGHFYTGLGTGYGGGAAYGQLIIANGRAYYPVGGSLICFEPAGR
jgi:hypothetical protein